LIAVAPGTLEDRMRSGVLACFVATCAALLPAGAAASRAPVSAPAGAEARPAGQAQRLERRFLQIAAANMRFQAEASQLVLARSNNPAVKDLAATLLARHKQAQPELLHLLQARSMAMPMLVSQHGKVLKQLGKSQGAKFDRQYVEEVVLRSSQADVQNYERLAAQAEDPVLKAWVDRQLPTLRFHLVKAGKALPSAGLRGQRAV
jgi:putative membrane protein